MMKKILALSVLLLGLILALYYGTGVVTERSLKKNLTSMQDSNKYKIKLVNYKRGFFNSRAVINLEILSPAKVLEKDGKKIFKPANTYFVSMPLEIYHGPIILVGANIKFGLGYAESRVFIPGNYIKNFDSKYTKDSTRPELNLNVFVNYATNTVVHVTSPKFSLVSVDKKSNFEWSGMTTTVDVTRDLSNIKGNLNIQDISWMQDEVSTVLKEVDSYFKLYKGDFDLYLGDSRVNIPSFIVSKNSSNLIELLNLDAKSNSFINEKLFNSSIQATIDKLYINKKTYQNCSLDLYVRNLDTKKLIEVNAKVKEAQNGTERQRRQVILSILPDLPELLNKGAEIEISDFNVEMQEGAIKGSFILNLAKDENKNPFYLIQKARGNGHIQISKPLLNKILADLYFKSESKKNINPILPTDASIDNSESIAKAGLENGSSKSDNVKDKSLDLANNKISELINRGYLADSGENFAIDIKIVQGRLMINDKPFSMDILRL